MRILIEIPDDQVKAVEEFLETLPRTLILSRTVGEADTPDTTAEQEHTEMKESLLRRKNKAIAKYLE